MPSASGGLLSSSQKTLENCLRGWWQNSWVNRLLAGGRWKTWCCVIAGSYPRLRTANHDETTRPLLVDKTTTERPLLPPRCVLLSGDERGCVKILNKCIFFCTYTSISLSLFFFKHLRLLNSGLFIFQNPFSRFVFVVGVFFVCCFVFLSYEQGARSIDYRCDNGRFWLSAHNCQVPTPTSQNLELQQQIQIFGAG